MHTNRKTQESYLIGIGWSQEKLNKLGDNDVDLIYKTTYTTMQNMKSHLS